MSIIAIDDTDSRTKGMCTTYVGHRIAEILESEHDATVKRVMLVRLNPAAKHKTRGNAAVAIHTDADASLGLDVASDFVSSLSADSDDMTNPGVVVCPDNTAPSEIQEFTHKVLTSLRTIEEAEQMIDHHDLLSYHMGNGRGRIGCLAAIGAWDALDDWTYECIVYREEENRGTQRMVNKDSVFDQSDKFYPFAWDTVDRVQQSAVCIPNTPGPILYGIRGDHDYSVEQLADGIISEEPVESSQLFVTNQGTDAHIVESDSIEKLEEDTAYQVDGVVCSDPETKEGGHVFFDIEDEESSIQVAAFEPTKHFRKLVRDLRVGDRLTVNGEVSGDTLKLEKFAVRDLVEYKQVNPTCPDCGRSMSSAGADQGYRCRDCSNYEDDTVDEKIDRELETGWYEVPPCARRHISKPLIRGGFDDNEHPFK